MMSVQRPKKLSAESKSYSIELGDYGATSFAGAIVIAPKPQEAGVMLCIEGMVCNSRITGDSSDSNPADREVDQ